MTLPESKPASKPTVLPPIFENIPPKLRELNQFGVWGLEEFTDEETGEVSWDKVPVNARTGRRASSTNPGSWSSFAQAVKAYERGGYDGLAFFLKEGGGIVGLDLDKCVVGFDPRKDQSGTPFQIAFEAWAESIVERLRTY